MEQCCHGGSPQRAAREDHERVSWSHTVQTVVPTPCAFGTVPSMATLMLFCTLLHHSPFTIQSCQGHLDSLQVEMLCRVGIITVPIGCGCTVLSHGTPSTAERKPLCMSPQMPLMNRSGYTYKQLWWKHALLDMQAAEEWHCWTQLYWAMNSLRHTIPCNGCLQTKGVHSPILQWWCTF